jgi:hypothetical protein
MINEMDNYEENIEDIEKRLDEILGGIGHKLKSFVGGLGGNKYTDSDARGSDVKINKDYQGYVASSGSDSEKKAVSGKPGLYKVGENYAKKVDDSLAPFLAFEVDEKETELKGTLVHTSNQEKAEKINSSIGWLFKGDWKAETLGLTATKRKARGAIKGKLVTFRGEWLSGAFMGVFKGGAITGGQMVDGYYLGSSDGYKIEPWDFKSGGSSIGSGFVMGLRMAKENTKHKKLSIIQVKKGLQIKILDNNDVEHLLKIDKGVDYDSLNMKINGVDVSWELYNRSSGDFEKSYINVGSNFDIPGLINIDKGVQSIEVKTSDYEEKESETEKGKESSSEKEEVLSKLILKTKIKGFGTTPKGYNIDLNNDKELSEKVSKFIEDIDSEKFFKYINFFKRLSNEGRIDGYGNYPALAFIYPKQKGEAFKDKDAERDRVMSYFSNFRQQVINNITADNISQRYMDSIKKEINAKPKVKKASKKSAKKAGTKLASPKNVAKAAMKESFYKSDLKLSISNIVKKII